MPSHRLLTFIATTAICLVAGAQERVPPGSGSPGGVTSSTRSAPSESMRANADARAAETDTHTRPSTRAIPMGLGSFGGVSSTTSPTLEGAMGSGARIPGTKTARKVCPPGLQNRDGNCVPPIEGIMRP